MDKVELIAVDKLSNAWAVEAIPALIEMADKGDSYAKLWYANALWRLAGGASGISVTMRKKDPLMVRKYSIRRGTGGNGQWKGGDGIIREIEILADKCTISIQSERRKSQPWGFNNGEVGEPGRNSLVYDGRVHPLEAKTTVTAPKGAIIRIETPGGGGYGPPPSVKK